MNATYSNAKGLSSYLVQFRGFSQCALETNKRLADIFASLYNTESLGEPIKITLDRLEEAVAECSSVDWDGYDAEPACMESYRYAKRFLRALPSGVPIPEITIEPSGEIGIEWYQGKGRIFVVSIDEDGMITYAGKIDRSKTHGTEYFFDEVPELILASLRKLVK